MGPTLTACAGARDLAKAARACERQSEREPAGARVPVETAPGFSVAPAPFAVPAGSVVLGFAGLAAAGGFAGDGSAAAGDALAGAGDGFAAAGLDAGDAFDAAGAAGAGDAFTAAGFAAAGDAGLAAGAGDGVAGGGDAFTAAGFAAAGDAALAAGAGDGVAGGGDAFTAAGFAARGGLDATGDTFATAGVGGFAVDRFAAFAAAGLRGFATVRFAAAFLRGVERPVGTTPAFAVAAAPFAALAGVRRAVADFGPPGAPGFGGLVPGAACAGTVASLSPWLR